MSNSDLHPLKRSDWEQLIPNRNPWLWVDDVLHISQTEIQTRKFLAPDLPMFQGHYPEFPLLPGVIQCEACLESSAILIAHLGVTTEGSIPVAARMNNVKFRRMVRPGETLEIKVELVDRIQSAFYLRGKVQVDGETSCQLDFVTTAAPHPDA